MLRIKEVIKEKGLTVEAVAIKLEVKRESLSRTINNNPSYKTLKKIASALNVHISELFDNTGDREEILLIYKNELKRFNSIKELKEFLHTIE
jgi:transcriptional regulator with XRE-family HTH domain